tara:strand:+ start:8722 stop:9066 length:345 start_codon:yes stop_codon:yes gene_type:complete
MQGQGKKATITNEALSKIQDSLGSDYEGMSFQIDLVNTEVTPRTEIVNFLNDNTERLQHLLDEEPRLIRWWFSDFGTAAKAMLKLSEAGDLNHRLICIEKKMLFVQVGDVFQYN